MTLLDDDFDFDEWAALHEQDPEAFERRRLALLERALQRGTEEQSRRMRSLLADFEANTRDLSDADRAAEANRLAVESMQSLGQQLDTLRETIEPTRTLAPSGGFRSVPGATRRRRRVRSPVH